MNLKQTFATGIVRRVGDRLRFAAIALGVLAATAAATGVGTAVGDDGASAAPVVAVAEGPVRGKVVGAVDQFLGIPYAAPPVGPLRWRSPQSATHWTGVRDATTFGSSCAQPATPLGLASPSEDRLYLNVYAPVGSQRGDSHPVMVWIHGGGWWL